MFKCTKWLAAALAALILVAAPVSAQTPYYFWWQVVDENGLRLNTNLNGVGDVSCSVFRPNIHGAAVLHSNASLSTAGTTSPLFNDSNGRLHFYSLSADPVDVNCYYRYGGQASVAKLDRFSHKIVIPRNTGLKISRFSVATSGVTAVFQGDSGIHIPAGGMIRDVIVQNLNPASAAGNGTYHINVGFLGNHSVAQNNSLVDRQSLQSPDEWLRPHAVATLAGIPGNMQYAASHRGSALAIYHAQLFAGPASIDASYYRERPYLVHVASGLTISYSVPGTLTVPIRVHVYILWQQFHSAGERQPAFQ